MQTLRSPSFNPKLAVDDFGYTTFVYPELHRKSTPAVYRTAGNVAASYLTDFIPIQFGHRMMLATVNCAVPPSISNLIPTCRPIEILKSIIIDSAIFVTSRVSRSGWRPSESFKNKPRASKFL